MRSILTASTGKTVFSAADHHNLSFTPWRNAGRSKICNGFSLPMAPKRVPSHFLPHLYRWIFLPFLLPVLEQLLFARTMVFTYITLTSTPACTLSLFSSSASAAAPSHLSFLLFTSTCIFQGRQFQMACLGPVSLSLLQVSNLQDLSPSSHLYITCHFPTLAHIYLKNGEVHSSEFLNSSVF